MNHFSFSIPKGEHLSDTADVEIVLTKASAKEWLSVLNEHFEIPLMQGTKETLLDGSVRVTMKLAASDAVFFRGALKDAYSKSRSFTRLN